jgi:hypothetical protein
VSAEQISLDAYREGLARRSRDTGATSALWNTDEWAKAAQLVLDELIERGEPFTSEDVRLVVGSPPSSGAFGAISSAHREPDGSGAWATSRLDDPPATRACFGPGSETRRERRKRPERRSR